MLEKHSPHISSHSVTGKIPLITPHCFTDFFWWWRAKKAVNCGSYRFHRNCSLSFSQRCKSSSNTHLALLCSFLLMVFKTHSRKDLQAILKILKGKLLLLLLLMMLHNPEFKISTYAILSERNFASRRKIFSLATLSVIVFHIRSN